MDSVWTQYVNPDKFIKIFLYIEICMGIAEVHVLIFRSFCTTRKLFFASPFNNFLQTF